jgi:hypothetical protein
MKNKNILLIILLILIICLFNYVTYKPVLESFESSTIPKKIWAFWDNDIIPDIVQKCINTWKKFNPDYEINIVNKKNLSEYLPDVDFYKIKHIDNSVEKFSDMVRLHLLSKYGGIWSDASVICLKPYDSWIPDLREETESEFIGFYIDSFTLPKFKETSPVIENWFFACTPGSIMIKDWLNEFLRISDYNTVQEYVDAVKAEGVNIQNISSPTYLSMHVACQKILQKGANRPYRFEVLKAEDTAFKYLTQNDWKSEKAIQNILDCKDPDKDNNTKESCDFLNSPIIKMRGDERRKMEKMNYSSAFL